ncbi:hypothetical protein K3495_g8808 [Podosphaera aphanis]|nr:hypothetical protein K3495_g8808 [Podosphaera aphanis]
MMASSTKNETNIESESYSRRAVEARPSKSALNGLILEYLITEGYPCAAARFSKEANLKPHQPDNEIRARYEIQHSVHTGDIQHALNLINDLDPEMLDREPSLHSDLLRLQLIELIRKYNSQPGGDISLALNFASQHLAPRASTNESFLGDLEKTMALLVFPPEQLEPQLASLLEPSLRRAVAEKVNTSILQRQKYRKEAAIRSLVRLRAWAEDTAITQNINIRPEMKFDFIKQETTDPGPMVT